MIEKVNPSHPDKVADRIAGAIVDYAYKHNEDAPKVAVEVLIGHNNCHIINETSVKIPVSEINKIVKRLVKEDITVDYLEVPQDVELAKNQENEIKCGDNGIFVGIPTNEEEKYLSAIAKDLYYRYQSDGKYIYDKKTSTLIVCQSNANSLDLLSYLNAKYCDIQTVKLNPLGDWTGGVNVDTGATNRKLGSDMGRAVTGGGLNGKDLSKADVSVNIVCHSLAQKTQTVVTSFCAIGDNVINFTFADNRPTLIMPYKEVVQEALKYINGIGGFEAFAEWGLI